MAEEGSTGPAAGVEVRSSRVLDSAFPYPDSAFLYPDRSSLPRQLSPTLTALPYSDSSSPTLTALPYPDSSSPTLTALPYSESSSPTLTALPYSDNSSPTLTDLPYPDSSSPTLTALPLPWTAPPPSLTALPLPVRGGPGLRCPQRCVRACEGGSEHFRRGAPFDLRCPRARFPESVAPRVPRRGPGARGVAPSARVPGRQGRVWLPGTDGRGGRGRQGRRLRRR